MREQAIVWRNDFENIEFRKETPLPERTVSEEVIICTQHGSKSVGLFCKCKDALYFEANSGTRWALDRIKEFAFLGQIIGVDREVNTMTAESLRNSILSLQQERASLQEQIEQNIAQEKALTEQLKELGFLLVESKEQPTNVVDEEKAVLYAEDIDEDMTDSRNWKVGDIIVATSYGYNNRLGVEYRVTKVGKTIHYECLDSRFTKNEYADNSEHKWLSSNYKFHSRPVAK